MSTLATEITNLTYSDREVWPRIVNVYQPREGAQILLPDFVACLAVKTFLRMCHLRYTVVIKPNAEYMSPSGNVPFIEVGRMLISEFEPIVDFAKTKGYQLSEHLSQTETVQMKAFMALVNNKLLQAELYLTWNDKEMYKRVTEQRYGQPFPWPLNRLIPFKKKWDIQCALKYKEWLYKPMDEVCNEVRTCCKALSDLLGDQVFFFGDKPTELDALVYGHIYSLLTTELPFKRFAEIVQEFKNLTEFCKRTDTQYYSQYVE